MLHFLAFIRRRYHAKPRSYWIKSLAVILLGVSIGALAGEHHVGLPWRYELSRLVQRLQPRQRARWTIPVLIEDDEYWRGSLARRSPIRRDYLARLVRTLSRCQPSVIALDFILRAPVVTGDLHDRFGTLRDNRDYTGETAQLVAAVREVSRSTPIVLPITLDQANNVEPTIVDEVPESPGSVRRGNINLPWDYREVPTYDTSRPRNVPSFALATAGFVNASLLAKFQPGAFPYDLTFVDPNDFQPVSYREAPQFPSSAECSLMSHKILLVGAGWHSRAYQEGEIVDVRHDTPMGPSVGALYLHANYIEALLDDRAGSLIPTPVAVAIEIGSAALIAFTLAGPGHSPEGSSSGEDIAQVAAAAPSRRRLRKYGVALAVAIALLFLTYVFIQNLRLYAEFFFPAFFLFLHAWWDDWRELSDEAAKSKATEARLAIAQAKLASLGIRGSLPSTSPAENQE
jgi:CHASE2 domain-containing sensor protein